VRVTLLSSNLNRKRSYVIVVIVADNSVLLIRVTSAKFVYSLFTNNYKSVTRWAYETPHFTTLLQYYAGTIQIKNA
jgi:hypothetical protein